MPIRTAAATWTGSLTEGEGSMSLGSGAFEGSYSFATRFEDEPGTNPEELLGAAQAGCFAMALSGGLGEAGYDPESVSADARVHLERGDEGFSVTRIELEVEADVPGIEAAEFQEHVADAEANCPVSRALAGVDVEASATLA